MKKMTKAIITATLSLGLLLNTGSLAFAGDRGAPDRPAMITLKKNGYDKKGTIIYKKIKINL